MGLVDLYVGGGPTVGGPHPSLAVLNRQEARFQDPRVCLCRSIRADEQARRCPPRHLSFCQ